MSHLSQKCCSLYCIERAGSESDTGDLYLKEWGSVLSKNNNIVIIVIVKINNRDKLLIYQENMGNCSFKADALDQTETSKNSCSV
jgi:hypothetical protein